MGMFEKSRLIEHLVISETSFELGHERNKPSRSQHKAVDLRETVANRVAFFTGKCALRGLSKSGLQSTQGS